MAKYRLRPLAYADLEEIWNYSAETWGMRQADSYLQILFEALESLAQSPLLGRNASDIREDYLQLRVQKHVVFYRVADEEIEIVRVLHERMLFDLHL